VAHPSRKVVSTSQWTNGGAAPLVARVASSASRHAAAWSGSGPSPESHYTSRPTASAATSAAKRARSARVK